MTDLFGAEVVALHTLVYGTKQSGETLEVAGPFLLLQFLRLSGEVDRLHFSELHKTLSGTPADCASIYVGIVSWIIFGTAQKEGALAISSVEELILILKLGTGCNSSRFSG